MNLNQCSVAQLYIWQLIYIYISTCLILDFLVVLWQRTTSRWNSLSVMGQEPSGKMQVNQTQASLHSPWWNLQKWRSFQSPPVNWSADVGNAWAWSRNGSGLSQERLRASPSALTNGSQEGSKEKPWLSSFTGSILGCCAWCSRELMSLLEIYPHFFQAA